MSTPERNSRLQKLKSLRDKGINPYPNRFTPENYSKEILEKFKDDAPEMNVKIAGRVMLVRNFGKAGFCTIKDSKGTIQIYGQKQELDDKFNVFKKLDAGDIIGVQGVLFRTQKGEITVNVKDFEILAKAIMPLPEKYHGLTDTEMRYRQRYTDLIVNDEIKESFLVRANIIRSIREQLNVKEFIEVETPVLQQIPGGANAKPFETYHNALRIPLFLRIAPELYLKRLIVGGMEKVYELSRVFRNEGISTKHNPEFTLLEIYQAYSDFNGMLELTEELVNNIAKSVTGKEEVEYQGKKYSFKRPFARMTLKEAIKKYADIDINLYKEDAKALLIDFDKKLSEQKQNIPEKTNGTEDLESKLDEKDLNFWKIVNDIFEVLVEDKLEGPIFITHYPSETSALAKQDPSAPEYVERFELFIAGREHANAYSELNDPIRQKENFEKQVKAKAGGDDEAMYMDEDYVNALEVGMPPTGGLGIGIDRLVMIFIDSPSIRDTILFPQMKPKKPVQPEKWKNVIDAMNKFSNQFTELAIKQALKQNGIEPSQESVDAIIDKTAKKEKFKTINALVTTILEEPGGNVIAKKIGALIKNFTGETDTDVNDFIKRIKSVLE